MILKEDVLNIISERLNEDDVYIVELKISSSNKISLYIDSDEGVAIDYCVGISRLIESNFDREQEDFELEVSSAGLSHPFKVLRQYKKNIGREVKVTLHEQKTLSGKLLGVSDEGITLEVSEKRLVEGKKRKQLVVEQQHIAFDDILKTEVVIKFK